MAGWSGVSVALALVLLPGIGEAQSLAEAARRAEEARRNATTPALTFDDRDLNPALAYQELLEYRLDASSWRRFVAADQHLARAFATDPALRQRFESLPESTSVRSFERFFIRETALGQALSASGSDAHAYAFAHLAVLLATRDSGKFAETLPPAVRDNAAFLKNHSAEVKRLAVPATKISMRSPSGAVSAPVAVAAAPRTEPAAAATPMPTRSILDPRRDDGGPIDISMGAQIPDFDFVDLSGRPRQLSDFHGRYLLLDFWGSWCGPCRSEVPYAKAAYDRFRSRGFDILGLDFEHDATPEQVGAYLAANGVTWTFARASSVKELIENRFHVSSFPTLVLLDPQGRVVEARTGTLRGNSLARTLDRILPK